MLFVLAPSKTMDFSAVDLKGNTLTQPEFQPQAERIVSAVKSTKDMAKLMKVSPILARATQQKYNQWGTTLQPAIYAYVGDVYKGFYAKTLSAQDVAWAQTHVRIMSGAYGMLRPLDAISGYRLDMKAPLAIEGNKDLYQFWGETLAKRADTEASDGIICILSSDEYARPITRHTKSRLITPVFLDNKPNGRLGTVPIYSKMMRGVLARWIIDHRVSKPEELAKFSAQGYHYDPKHSTANQPAFYRENPRPIEYKK